MKTYKEWMDSDTKTIEEYLNVGDEVDNEIIEHFTEKL